ncbi:MAG: hypothetical protein KGI83_07790, partial [Verrucomicrobiota bacterium]|nr:hypothetical protein [Verrucomicrobiota bacterium]
LLGFVVTSALGHHLLPWQTLFGMAALISLTSIIVQFRIPIAAYPVSIVEQNWSEKILHPWRDAFHLLRSNPHFFRVQCGFMFGGVGLMLAAPSLSLFCVDILALSHTDITLGRSVLMGIGVAVSAYFWKKMIAMEKIDQILRNVLLGFSLYLLCLCVSYFEVSFFYLAYVLYGLSQAGSHLLWNLSGPMFAKEADSAQYTRVNILMVGLRGSITPAIGGVLCHCCGPAFVILLSAGICLAGVLYMTITQTVIGRRQKQLLDH